MTEALLFDASSILMVVRELGRGAIDVLSDGLTIPLVNYEVGNAVWKECFLLKRMDKDEALRLLRIILTIVGKMNIVRLEDNEELVTQALTIAGVLNVTYYDASYLATAQKLGKSFVTEDEKLRKVAERMGIKTTNISRLCLGLSEKR